MKESYYTLLTQAIQMGGGLLVFKILTLNLSSNDFGIYALILSFSGIVFAFPFTAIQQALIKYSSVLSYKKALDIYDTTVIVDFILFIIYFILAGFCIFFNLISINKIEYILISFYIFTEVLKINNYMFLNSLRNRKKYFISVLIEFSLKVIILSIFTESVYDIFIIFILINVIGIIYSKPLNINYKIINNKKFLYWLKMIYIFAFPLAIWGIFGWMRDMSNRWIIEYYLSLSDVALFAVMNSLVVIVPGALQAFFGMYFMPILYKKEKERKGSIREFNKKLLVLGFLIIILGTVFINFTSEYIVTILSDNKYVGGAWMLAPMFFAYSLFSLSMSTTSEIFAHNKTKLLLMPNIISGIASVIAFLFLVKFYGMNGALYAFIISYLSYSILTFFVVYRFKF